jgi:putative DNA primase/helicase
MSNKGYRFQEDNVKGISEIVTADKGPHKETWLCSPLRVAASFRSPERDGWGRIVEFTDPDGNLHRSNVAMRSLVSDPKITFASLVNEGLRINNARQAQEALVRYIQTQKVTTLVRCVSQVGWYKDSYALPDQSIQPKGAEPLVFTGATAEYRAVVSGTVQDWINSVGMRCSGNTRAVFAVSAAFAPPLLELLKEESGGVHLLGGSSSGKTTLQVVAGSVWGGGGREGYVRSWRATSNGVEAMAAMHNDGLLCLDELSQIDPRDAVDIAYLLANGAGKQRMNKAIQAQTKASWRLLFLSSGEVSLSQHIASIGRKTLAGQRIRLLDVPADAGAGLGVFEDIHGAKDGATFSAELRHAALTCHGSPIRGFMQALVSGRKALVDKATRIRDRFISDVVPADSCGEVFRAAGRFALIAAAGELASALGITGWKEGEANAASQKCFLDWLQARGTSKPSDEEAAVQQVIGFIQQYAASRFQEEDPYPSNYVARDRAGFIRVRQKTRIYLIFPAVFAQDVCSGYDPQFVAKALRKRRMLLGQKGKHLTIRTRLKGLPSSHRVYAVVLP